MSNKVSLKNISTVIIESSVVGLLLLVLFFILQNTTSKKISTYYLLFVAGFLFHFIFEYTGLNKWYSLEYCKLQAKK